MNKLEKNLQELGYTRCSDTYHFGKAQGDSINTNDVQQTCNETHKETMQEYIDRQLKAHTNTLTQQNNNITELNVSVSELSDRSQYYDNQISTMLNHSEPSFGTACVHSEVPYITQISLDGKIEIRYKDRIYVIDPETLINVLFNLDEIVRAIVREEIYNG